VFEKDVPKVSKRSLHEKDSSGDDDDDDEDIACADDEKNARVNWTQNRIFGAATYLLKMEQSDDFATLMSSFENLGLNHATLRSSYRTMTDDAKRAQPSPSHPPPSPSSFSPKPVVFTGENQSPLSSSLSSSSGQKPVVISFTGEINQKFKEINQKFKESNVDMSIFAVHAETLPTLPPLPDSPRDIGL
jgi:hypothetical protein